MEWLAQYWPAFGAPRDANLSVKKRLVQATLRAPKAFRAVHCFLDTSKFDQMAKGFFGMAAVCTAR